MTLITPGTSHYNVQVLLIGGVGEGRGRGERGVGGDHLDCHTAIQCLTEHPLSWFLFQYLRAPLVAAVDTNLAFFTTRGFRAKRFYDTNKQINQTNQCDIEDEAPLRLRAAGSSLCSQVVRPQCASTEIREKIAIARNIGD